MQYLNNTWPAVNFISVNRTV